MSSDSSATTKADASAVQKLDSSWTKIADEGFNFSVPAGTVVQFGANDSYIQKTVSGGGVCTSDFFGQDPAYMVVKACYVQSGTATTTTTTSPGTLLVSEGFNFTVPSATVVSYGAGSNWIQKTVSGAGTCTNAFFGSDPAPNVAKACYTGATTTTTTPTTTTPTTTTPTTTTPTTTTATPGALLAGEAYNFTVSSSTVVLYGAGSSWLQKTVTGTGNCTNAFFGGDPAPNVVKACYASAGTTTTTPTTTTPTTTTPTTTTPTTTAPASGTQLAAEGQNFTVSSATSVQYGAGSSWIVKSVTGTGSCTNAYFGQDPLPNTVKACYSLGATGTTTTPTTTTPTTTTPTTTTPTTTGPALGSDIVDASLNVVPSAYVAMAAQIGKDAGLAYRYGPDAAAYGVGNGGLPTLAKRNDNLTRCGTTGCLSSWQVGGPRNPGDDNPGASQAAAGLYSTNQANVLFAADNPAQRVGVADIQISAHEYNTFAQMPQLSWTIQQLAGGGIDSQGPMAYKAQGLLDSNSPSVAIGHCGGRAGFCATSVVAYQNGVLGTSGTNTATNRLAIKLPSNKVPTAVAMTNISEFALVTVWDTTAMKGQIAVVSLAGLCEGCTPSTPKSTSGWGDWLGGLYPGLPSLGDIGFMKILGYVDLPGITAPTEIAVTTGMDQFDSMLVGGTFVGHATTLTNESERQSFNGSGSNFRRYAKGGVAVVISKSEQKAAFVDLKPLFSYLNSVYFGGTQSSFSSTVNNLGQADNQWPYTFAQVPSQMPTVIKTVSLGARPTAVKTTQSDSVQRAWIATQDGTLRIFSLGNYTSGTGTASDIAEKSTVAVGRNPTSLALSKNEPDDSSIDPMNRQVLVTSRGDRKVQWVRFAADGNSGYVARELKDTRLVDPVSAEDADNFATVGNVLSVADYAGKAVSNYRYGTVIFAERGGSWACQPPGGCPVNPTGSSNIEFGGSMAFPGKVFKIATTNVP